jgi:predicted phage terminase large subunit-like protein
MAKEKVRSWVDTSVITRFKDHSNGVLIVVMHRLAPDDLSGTLEQRPGWEVIKLPLVAESRESFEVAGNILMHRQPGYLLNPNRMTPEDLGRLKNDIEPHVFASQYQQRPTAGGSGMCSIDRFERYDKPPPFELKIHSWDIAATPGGNFTVCTNWGVAKLPEVGDALFLTGVVRIRVELPDVRNTIIMHDKLDKPDLIVIDGGGVGLAVYQDLRRQGNRHVYKHGEIPDNSQSSPKIERFGKALLRIYDGRVRFPIAAPFLDLFFSEIAAFPNGKYDDQVDSMTQLVATMRHTIRLARLKLRPR